MKRRNTEDRIWNLLMWVGSTNQGMTVGMLVAFLLGILFMSIASIWK